MNPADQSAIGRLSRENNVAWTCEQSLKARPHRISRYRIAKLAGKTCHLGAILLACMTYVVA
ncbi:MAG TPA: hypothetical protein VH619_03860 [Verrucomicrobiae bacterium]|nr:hypothetical protein [Verrucomicrobiae bacterium]